MTNTNSFHPVPFTTFKELVQVQLEAMEKTGLYTTTPDAPSKDALWETYLESYPEGTNLLYKERREYDCNCCKNFIRAVGGVVTIIDNKPVSIWDVNVGGYYQPVVDALTKQVKSLTVKDHFLHFENNLGTDKTPSQQEDGTVKVWEHFHHKLASEYVLTGDSIPSKLAKLRSQHDVLSRSLKEITSSATEVVLELIKGKNIYKGDEFKGIVEALVKIKAEYDSLPDNERDNFTWVKAKELGEAAKFKNTVIGTLLSDISEGVDLEVAVLKYEAKVAPENYKRSSAVVTKRMIEEAQKTVLSLGLESALNRRYSIIGDITVNNVLYVDRSVKPKMKDAFSDLLDATPQKIDVDKLDKVDEMSIDDFMSNVVPTASKIEVVMENKHVSNLVSLISPVDESVNMLKWGNNFSWDYHGGLTDASLRDSVKALGGRVDGVLRFSHTWNYDGNNQSLMDLHVFMPGWEGNGKGCIKNKEVHDNYGFGQRVGWNNRKDYISGGVQDVDYTAEPGTNIPVENITYPKMSTLKEGKYLFKIHNWESRKNPRSGFKAEIEINGEVYEYEYSEPVGNKEWITVAEATLKSGVFTIDHKLESKSSSKNIWGVNTQSLTTVKTILNSPNHWDGESTGNKHIFFMLEGCTNPDEGRGFYNEFLSNDLKDHRKVFEVLGSRLKTPKSEDQLSGLGFSSTQRNEALFKVTGNFIRMIKVKF